MALCACDAAEHVLGLSYRALLWSAPCGSNVVALYDGGDLRARWDRAVMCWACFRVGGRCLGCPGLRTRVGSLCGLGVSACGYPRWRAAVVASSDDCHRWRAMELLMTRGGCTCALCERTLSPPWHACTVLTSACQSMVTGGSGRRPSAILNLDHLAMVLDPQLPQATYQSA